MTDIQAEKREACPEDGLDSPPLKRKKTVTWAGDVPETSVEGDAVQDEPTVATTGPSVLVLEQDQDVLFADLDSSIVEHQDDVPLSSIKELSTEALLQRRMDNIDQLYQIYEEEMWGLYSELHLRRSRLKKQQQAAAVQQSAADPSGPPSASAADPSAGDEPFQSAHAALEQSGQEAPSITSSVFSLRQLVLQQQGVLKAGPAAAVVDSGAAAKGAGAGLEAVVSDAGAAAEGSSQHVAQGQGQEQEGQSGREGGVKPAGGVVEQAGVQQQQGSAGGSAGSQGGGAGAVLPARPQEGQQQHKHGAPGSSVIEGATAAAANRAASGGAGAGVAGGLQKSGAPMDHPVPLFEEVEGLMDGLDPAYQPPPQSMLRAQRAKFLRHLELIGRLEQSMLNALCRELDRHSAVAALCGRRQRYLLRRTAVLVGRNTQTHSKVDVDLSAEGNSQTVSRLQAQLVLEPEGRFYLRCLGRRKLFVNGQQVVQGAVAAVPHLSLIKVGGVSLLFLVNHSALQRLKRRSAAVAV